MERRIEFSPAYDKRNPDPRKNYGIHGLEMRWYLIGPLGAVQFVLFTGWHLPHVRKELGTSEPLPADIGYHSLKPMYEEQAAMRCHLIPGGECYYDGSSLNAEKYFNILVEKGGDALWEALEAFYHEQLEAAA